MEQGNLSKIDWGPGLRIYLAKDGLKIIILIGGGTKKQSDSAFAQALLDEAIILFVNGEPESAKLILRDLVNATVDFESLAEEILKPAKSLYRMLSQSVTPR